MNNIKLNKQLINHIYNDIYNIKHSIFISDWTQPYDNDIKSNTTNNIKQSVIDKWYF